jgi:hypothetical protein
LQLFNILQEADQAPTTQAAEQISTMHAKTEAVIQQWADFAHTQLTPLKLAP